MSESVASTSAAPAAPAATAAPAAATDSKAADQKAAPQAVPNGKVEQKGEAKQPPTMTVDGKEVALTEEMIREFQKQAAADKRLKEAAEARKSIDAEKAKIDGLVQAL